MRGFPDMIHSALMEEVQHLQKRAGIPVPRETLEHLADLLTSIREEESHLYPAEVKSLLETLEKILQ